MSWIFSIAELCVLIGKLFRIFIECRFSLDHIYDGMHGTAYTEIFYILFKAKIKQIGLETQFTQFELV